MTSEDPDFGLVAALNIGMLLSAAGNSEEARKYYRAVAATKHPKYSALARDELLALGEDSGD